MTSKNRLITAILVVSLLSGPIITLSAGVAGATAPEDGTRTPDLFVQQPRWVDTPVKTTKINGTTVYKVRGQVQEVELQNINRSNVVDYGVANGNAVMSYDKDIGRYILDTQGESGSYRVFWTVTRTDTVTRNNTTMTETKTLRYSAIIQVNDANMKHIEESKLNRLQEAAANWSATVKAFEGVGVKSVEADIERSAVILKFVDNPFSALNGQIVMILFLLGTTPGGLVLLGVNFTAVAVLIRGLVTRLQKRESELEDIEDIEREKQEMASRKKLQDLAQCDPTDAGLNDHYAHIAREYLGPNILMIFDTLAREVTDRQWITVHLQILDQLGYAARLNRPRTDGGDGSGDDVSVEFVPRDEAEDDEDVRSLANPDEEVLSATTEDDITTLNVDYVRSDIDMSRLDLPVANDDNADDDLPARLGIEIDEERGDIPNREVFIEDIVLPIIEFVASHPYTDEEGYVREEMDLLSVLNLLATAGAEKYDLPKMTDYKEVFEVNIEALSSEERAMDSLGGLTDE